jgi:hypothetical protein
MNYQAMFRDKALEGFDLFAKDYFNFIDIEKIKEEIDDYCKNDFGEYLSPKKALRQLQTLFDKYNFIFDNPSLLTKDDQMAIFEMKRYLNSHKGSEFGYIKYRKQHYENEVIKLYELVLERNMNLLVCKDIIFLEIERKIEFIQNHQNSKEMKIHHFFTLEKAKEQRNEWSKKRVLCVCGKEYRQGDKYKHCNTEYHKRFIQETSKKELILWNGENISLKIEEV